MATSSHKPSPKTPAKGGKPEKAEVAEKIITTRYQGWELNGKGKPKGVWPYPPHIRPSVCTEIDTDRKGTILEVREFRDGTPKPLVRKFTQGKQARLEKQEYTDPLTGISGKNLYEYDDKGNMKARQEVDPKGSLRFRIEVTVDSSGRFSEERVLDAAKRGINRHVYSYDAQGRMTKDETYVGKELKELQGFHVLDYDTKGHITRRAWNTPKGEEIEAFVYKYDELDRRVEMGIEKGGKRTMTSVYKFDITGKNTSTQFVDGDGKAIAEELRDPTPPTAKEIKEAMDSLQGKLKEVAKSDPKKLDAIAQVAYSQFEAGQLDDARRIFESLSIIDPDNAYYMSGVAAVALQQDQAQTALNYYDRALKRDPKHVASLVGRGDALLRLGRVDESLGAVTEALKVAKPTDPALRRARAIVSALTQAPAQKNARP